MVACASKTKRLELRTIRKHNNQDAIKGKPITLTKTATFIKGECKQMGISDNLRRNLLTGVALLSSKGKPKR